MAITNAQQYQQLVNKPANGKRPGYRGDAAYGDRSDKDAIGDGPATKNPNEETGGNKKTATASDPQDPFFRTRPNDPPPKKPRVTETKDKVTKTKTKTKEDKTKKNFDFIKNYFKVHND
jgi:hypothetical protein